MAKLTNQQLSVELSTLRVAFQQLEATNALLREEVSRKEAWINRYAAQLKQARAKAEAPESDFKLRAAAAREEAIRTGATVKV